MILPLALLIVAIQPDASIASRYPAATEIFACNFDASWDENFDEWPDQWTRRRGRNYPHYVEAVIGEDPTAEAGRCLRIDLDGGAAVACSPPIPVDDRHSYVLEGRLKTEGLKHDRARFSLALLDDQRQRLEVYTSESVRHVEQWTKFRIGPISPSSRKACWAVIGLHLEPDDHADLTGSASFSDIWLGRLPRMGFELNSPYHLYFEGQPISATCTTSGFAEGNPTVTFLLENVLGNPIAEAQPPLEIEEQKFEEILPQPGDLDAPPRVGKATWQLPVTGSGFYRLWAALRSGETTVYRHCVTFAVIHPESVPVGGEFGWSLPRGARPLDLPELGKLLPQAGVNWVKFPLWYDESLKDDDVARLVGFAERLSAQGIGLVGLLCEPPADLAKRYEARSLLTAAEIFSPEPEVWYPSLELVMMRLATQVRWWQLGADQDTSYVGYPNLREKIGQVKSQLDRIGQDVNLGIGWGWMNQLPQAEDAPWRFLSLSSRPSLTALELEAYLKVTHRPKLNRWVVLEPLAARQYPVEVRAADLLRRMVAAKIHGAEAVFIPDPFDPDSGLMNPDGTPGELLLPWRTTSLMLSGAEHLGSMQLPQGSPNHIFARDGTAAMLVWNYKPVTEVLYLGDNVRQVDLWSHSRIPEAIEDEQVIEVGPLPVFVTGLNLEVTRWRQSLSFATDRVPSVFGGRHRNGVRVTNGFGTGIAGSMRLVGPEVWNLRPDSAEFRLAENEVFQMPLEMTLPYNATSGRHPVYADFEIQADRPYRFRVYRTIEVGMGDVYLQCTTRLNERGELEIEQWLVNETAEPVSFRCELFAPDRRRMKTDAAALGQSRDVKVYHMCDGKELVGKTLWLRAEQIGGARVLNYRFRVAP